MTPNEIYQMLSELGYPVTYLEFPKNKVPPLPYICYYMPSRNDESADNINYAHISTVAVELYTKEKDFDTERRLENLLEAHELFYTKEEQRLDEEHMYEILYEMEVVL